MTSKVDWYGDQVILTVDKITVEALTALALRLEEHAKVNIVRNDQVDTGAMLNGIYALSPLIDNYAAGARGGSGGDVLPRLGLPDGNSALVAGAMSYTIYQEIQKPFLYPALEKVAAEAGGILKTIAAKHT